MFSVARVAMDSGLGSPSSFILSKRLGGVFVGQVDAVVHEGIEDVEVI